LLILRTTTSEQSTAMAQSALERMRELDKEKLAILLQAEANALDTIREALKELKMLATEHLKIEPSARRSPR
jgi:hypothetical protein